MSRERRTARSFDPNAEFTAVEKFRRFAAISTDAATLLPIFPQNIMLSSKMSECLLYRHFTYYLSNIIDIPRPTVVSLV